MITGNQRSLSLCVHAIIVSVARRAVNPIQPPVAPTNAACGLAGLGVLGVDRVAAAPDVNTAPCSVNPFLDALM